MSSASFKDRIAESRAYALVLWASRRAEGCSLGTILHSTVDDRVLEGVSAKMAQKCHKLRTEETRELWETPDGNYWIPQRPLSAESLFEMLGEDDLGVYFHPECQVRQGDIVIDCGANIGTFTRAALARGAARVIGAEPSPDNLACLRRNFEAEIADGRVVTVAKGLWNVSTTLYMTPGGSPAGDSFMRGGTDGIPLPVTTIDELVEELGLSRVDFIKMDIEGAERHALAGGRKTIARDHPRLAISAYHLPDDPVVLKDEVAKSFAGYRCASLHARVMALGLLKSRITPMVYFFWA